MSATGTYEHSLDAKGRLFIPAPLRKELGDTLYVTMGLDGCLAVYPQSTWNAFTEQFASRPMTETRGMRRLFSNAAKCEPDSQGRIVLPQKLRTFAGLVKDAVIIGVHNRAEIWSVERWSAEEEEEMTPERMNAILGDLGL